MKLIKTGRITHTVKLTGEDITEMLANCGTDYTANDTATVKFKVPSGGDHSGMSVDVTEENCVTVTWTTDE